MSDYRRRFIELMAPLANISEEIAKGQYVSGLKEEIRAEVRLLGPMTLEHAMDLSLKAEEKLRIGPAHRRGGSFLYGNKIQNQHSQFLSLPHKNKI